MLAELILKLQKQTVAAESSIFAENNFVKKKNKTAAIKIFLVKKKTATKINIQNLEKISAIFTTVLEILK